MVEYKMFSTLALSNFGVHFGHMVYNTGEEVPLIDVLVLGNLCDYHHNSNVSKN